MTSVSTTDQGALIDRLTFKGRTLVHESLVFHAGAMVLGAGGYFLLPFNPETGWVVAIGLIVFALWVLSSRTKLLAVGTLAFWAMLGFAVAHAHTVWKDTPLLWSGRMPWATIQAQIKAIDYREDGPRLMLSAVEVIDGRGLGWLNGSGLQLNLTGENNRRAFNVGQRVEGRIQLFSIGPPPVPGSLDLQFRAYFQGVSAYASTRGDLVVLDEGAAKSGFYERVQDIRTTIRNRIITRLGEERGSVLVAMTVGFPRGIPDDRLEEIRASGLAHLLAISGLHMSLIVLNTFIVMRLLMAFLEARAVPWLWRIQPKKLSILVGLALGLGYFFISGQGVPVQRAFIMVCVFGAAILLDRRGVSLRTLALAAILVVLAAPNVIMGPSFQMSFAAVTALIIVGNMLPHREMIGPIWSTLGYIGGIALTSALATLATATLTLFHFGQVSLISVFANILAVPITGLVVMPFALIAIVLMPLGADGWALDIAGLGIDAILWIAKVSAELPLSTIEVASWPRVTPLLFAIGLILVAGFHRWAKLVAVIPAIALVAAIAIHRPADLILTPELGVATVGHASPEVDDFQLSFMGEYWATPFESETWVALRSSLSQRQKLPGTTCTAQGCLLGPDHALSWTREATNQLCSTDRLIIAPHFVPRGCGRDRALSDFAWAKDGPYALWVSDDGSVHLQSDADRRGYRPWSGRSKSED